MTDGAHTHGCATGAQPGLFGALIVAVTLIVAFAAGDNHTPSTTPTGEKVAAVDAPRSAPNPKSEGSSAAPSIVAAVAVAVAAAAVGAVAAAVRWSNRKPAYIPDGNVHELETRPVRELPAGVAPPVWPHPIRERVRR